MCNKEKAGFRKLIATLHHEIQIESKKSVKRVEFDEIDNKLASKALSWKDKVDKLVASSHAMMTDAEEAAYQAKYNTIRRQHDAHMKYVTDAKKKANVKKHLLLQITK